MSILTDKLNNAWNNYERELLQISMDEFNGVIKPWLDKWNYSFVGGGAWGWMVYDNLGHRVDEEYIPEKILDVLNCELDGLNGSTLGDIMPAYKTDKRKY